MNKHEKLAIIVPVVADGGPFVYYGVILQLRPNVPWVVGLTCSFAPLIMGISTLIALAILRHRNAIPKGSDSVIIGTVLAIVGILETFFL